MKVLCIREEWVNRGEGDPSFGDTCTVIDSYDFMGKLIYILKEYPHPGGYEAAAFVPLSDIDESELILERQEVKYH